LLIVNSDEQLTILCSKRIKKEEKEEESKLKKKKKATTYCCHLFCSKAFEEGNDNCTNQKKR
jgi:hypothetical protein